MTTPRGTDPLDTRIRSGSATAYAPQNNRAADQEGQPSSRM